MKRHKVERSCLLRTNNPNTALR